MPDHPREPSPGPQIDAVVGLLQQLAAAGYHFVAPTPSTCRRTADKAQDGPRTLRDIFGWNLPFAEADLAPELLASLQAAGGLEREGERLRSTLRVANLDGRLFAHSRLGLGPDAVFLGPDSYRFANFIEAELAGRPALRVVVDMGAGAGVGGLVAARCAQAQEVVLIDVNPKALRLAEANAAFARQPVRTVQGDRIDAGPEAFDLLVMNPPYIAGRSGSTYKDGGDMHGLALSLDWARTGLARLAPGGRILLYTGSAILDGGGDPFRTALEQACAAQGCAMRYRELDPDIFSGELRREAYADVERIAAVGAVITRPPQA